MMKSVKDTKLGKPQCRGGWGNQTNWMTLILRNRKGMKFSGTKRKVMHLETNSKISCYIKEDHWLKITGGEGLWCPCWSQVDCASSVLQSQEISKCDLKMHQEVSSVDMKVSMQLYRHLVRPHLECSLQFWSWSFV